jgi:hypothetical protein
MYRRWCSSPLNKMCCHDQAFPAQR